MILSTLEKTPKNLPKSRLWPRRPLPCELHVPFRLINDRMDTAERRMSKQTRPLVRYLTGRIKGDIRRYSSGSLRLFNTGDSRRLERIYNSNVDRSSAEFGKLTAREYRMDYQASLEVVKELKRAGKIVIANMFRNIEASIETRVKKAPQVEATLSPANTTAIVAVAGSLLEGGMDRTASVMTATTIFAIRNDVFKSIEEPIYSYLYSAVLDINTCPVCSDLDGMNLTEENYSKTQWIPPIHHLCRCVWVAILERERDKPRRTPSRQTAGGAKRPPFTDYMEKNGYSYDSVRL